MLILILTGKWLSPSSRKLLLQQMGSIRDPQLVKTQNKEPCPAPTPKSQGIPQKEEWKDFQEPKDQGNQFNSLF